MYVFVSAIYSLTFPNREVSEDGVWQWSMVLHFFICWGVEPASSVGITLLCFCIFLDFVFLYFLSFCLHLCFLTCIWCFYFSFVFVCALSLFLFLLFFLRRITFSVSRFITLFFFFFNSLFLRISYELQLVVWNKN